MANLSTLLKTPALILAVGLFAACAPVASGGGRQAGTAVPLELSEPTGGFAYTPPPGWQTQSLLGLQYRVAHAPPANGFAANIVVEDERFAGSVEAYAATNRESLAKTIPEFRSTGQGGFVTQTGLKGVRLVTRSRQRENLLRQVFYFLPGYGDRKYVLVLTALLEDGAKHDASVDASVKTFELR